MAVPCIRNLQKLAAGVIGTPVLMTDAETGLTFVNVTKGNAILDITDNVAIIAGDFYTIELLKNGVDTGRRFYSQAMDPASAGRMAVGPIVLSPGNYSFLINQTAGVAAVFAIAIKFADVP